MKTTAQLGMNRTGIGTSPADARALVESADEGTPSSVGDAGEIDRVRDEFEAEASPIGSVPPPPTVKGVVKAAVETLKGAHTAVLLDRIGERLAFERTGVRLYEALLQKRRKEMNGGPGPAVAELERLHDQELAHFEMLQDCLEDLGADPTVETPSADLAGIMSSGVGKVLTDPRTTLTQALEAILVAELVDNDSWRMLADLARSMGKKEMGARFDQALAEEDEHLALVRRWLSERVIEEAR
jgi:rubrerythrin